MKSNNKCSVYRDVSSKVWANKEFTSSHQKNYLSLSEEKWYCPCHGFQHPRTIKFNNEGHNNIPFH